MKKIHISFFLDTDSSTIMECTYINNQIRGTEDDCFVI